MNPVNIKIAKVGRLSLVLLLAVSCQLAFLGGYQKPASAPAPTTTPDATASAQPLESDGGMAKKNSAGTERAIFFDLPAIPISLVKQLDRAQKLSSQQTLFPLPLSYSKSTSPRRPVTAWQVSPEFAVVFTLIGAKPSGTS